jgi:Asp-tRNA(Asn)/Glu-tRNA(Gln) amidotransferase A subunit family amidase
MSKSKIAPNYAGFMAARPRFFSGEDSPRAFLERCIERIDAHDATVKAFVCKSYEQARQAADASTERYRKGAPLSLVDGMPLGVKDIIDTADMPTQMNNAYFNGHQSRIDAACVKASRLSGAVVVGKTVTTEFAIGRSGPTVNPWNAEHTPGGSSSGSAAGAAAGFFSTGFGTQTQGSTIRPASYCGVVGYKPTLGALPLEGVHPLSTTHDHLGLLSEGVTEAWALARQISATIGAQDSLGLNGPLDTPVTAQAPLRVGVMKTQGWEEMDAASASAFDKVLAQISALGVELVWPMGSRALADFCQAADQIPEKSLDLVAMDMRWPFIEYLEKAPDLMGPRIHELIQRASRLTDQDYRAHLLYRDALREAALRLSTEFDCLLLPAASSPAPEGFVFTGSRTLLTYSSFLGLPAYSIPATLVGGLPLGVQLMGAWGQDYMLTRHAAWLHERLCKNIF